MINKIMLPDKQVGNIISVSDLVGFFDKKEVWAPAYGWPLYEVSSWGSVRRNGRVLKPALSHGYQFVTLSMNGKSKSVRVHRLILLTFYGEAPFEGAICAHNDGNKENNRISNLRWASLGENQADRVRHGTKTRGSAVFGAKLSESDIPVIRARLLSGERYPSIASDFNVSISTISLIKLGRVWAHV